MIKKLLYTTLLIISANIYSQVGIGTTAPNADALLDIDASISTGGLLLPRLALTNTTSPAPLTANVAGMTVYNTATVADVSPGMYYNNGSIWVRLGSAANNDWSLTGNAGTTFGTNFIGTTDNVDVSFKRDGQSKIRILNSVTSFANEIRTRDGSSDSGDVLFRVFDSSDDGVLDIYQNNSVNHRIHGNGTTIFNELQSNIDFRI